MGDRAEAGTFHEHVGALRKRLIYPAALFLIGGTIAYFFYNQIIAFIRGSLTQQLYYDAPAGNFMLIMKICVLCGLALAIPALVYNLIRFVQPAFAKFVSRKSVVFVSILSLVLALSGAAFAMYVIVPMSLKFFGGFKINGVQPLLSANEYLNFVLTAIMSSMIMFQIPLVVLFIDFVHPVPPSKFLKFGKWVIIGSVAIALVLPFTYDPITQFVVALPIVGLYYFSILLIWYNHQMRARKARKLEAVPAPVAAAQPAQEPVRAPVPERPQPRPQLRPRLISDMRMGAGLQPRPVMAAESRPHVTQTKAENLRPTHYRKVFDIYS